MSSAPSQLTRLVPVLIWIGLLGCQHDDVNRQRNLEQPSLKSAKPNLATPKSLPRGSYGPGLDGAVSVSPLHAEELRQIISLVRHNAWEEAEARASALYAIDPHDNAVQRIFEWVNTEGPRRRDSAVENDIRTESSRESRFNPTLKSLLADKKSGGLPPRSGLRETIERLTAEAHIPETYGRRVQNQGKVENLGIKTGRMAELMSREVEVQLDNASLEEIIFNLGQAQGINFIADKSLPAFQQRLRVRMKGAKLSEVMSYIERNLNLHFQVGEDLVWILDAKDTNKVALATRFYHLQHGFITPAQLAPATLVRTTIQQVVQPSGKQDVERFVEDGTRAETALEMALKKYFDGQYQIDYEHNLIVARGTPSQLAMVERIIKEYDRPVKQVLIETRFILLSESAFNRLGVIWESTTMTGGSSATIDYTGFASLAVGMGIEMTWWGILGRAALNAVLSALNQQGSAVTLSSCRLTVVNNLPAKMSDGKTQYYYEEYKVAETSTEDRSTSMLYPVGKPTPVTQGVALDVMASIGEDGNRILLALRPEVNLDVEMIPVATVENRNAKGEVIIKREIKLPTKTQQTLATRVMVKSGQTLILGGVLRREQKRFVEATPVLGNLPLIGQAFRRQTDHDNLNYLLAFVSASLLSEKGEIIVDPESN